MRTDRNVMTAIGSMVLFAETMLFFMALGAIM